MVAHGNKSYNGWGFSYDPDTHKAFLVNGGEEGFSGDIVVPETVISEYDGETYTVVGATGFENNPNITSVTLPATIMDSSNFYGCTGLKSVTYKAQLTTIDEKTFYECTSLENVDLPSTVTTIMEEAFYGCSSLRFFHWPTELRVIEKAAFRDCISFITETLPTKLVEIGESAFAGCTSLTNVIVPSSVEIIRPYAYSGCMSLESCHINESATPLSLFEDYASPFEDSALKHLYIGRNWVGQGPAFGTKLTDVEIRGDVTIIPFWAFHECADLERVIISEPVEKIETSAFGFCYNLTNIDLPASLKTIDEYAFESSGLRSVTLPSKATDLGENIFFACADLESAALPDALTYIPLGMFDMCYSLKNISWPENLTAIGLRAFSQTAFESLEIPETVTYIDGAAFSICENLVSVKLPSQIEEISGSLFYGCTSLPAIDLPKNIKRIEGGAFSSCSSLTSIAIPEGVTSIGISAFMSTPLQEIRIPDSVTEIGTMAFASTKIKTATFGKNVNSIGLMPFYYGALAKAIWLGETPPDGIENVEAAVQYTHSTQFPENCLLYSSLEDRFVVDGVVYVPVDNDSKYVDIIDCSYQANIQSVEIPESIKSETAEYKVRNINPYAFYNNQTLTATLLSSAQTIGSYAFAYCGNLATVETGNTTETIESCAFYNIALRELTLGSGLKSLGTEAFAHNWDLNKITCKATVPPVCQDEVFIFTDYNTCRLFVPTNSVDKYKAAFQWKEFTNIVGENFNDGFIDCVYSDENLSPESHAEIFDTNGRLLYKGILKNYREKSPSLKIVKVGSNTYKTVI